MAYTKIKNWLEEEISNIHKSGLYKKENILTSSQSTNVDYYWYLALNLNVVFESLINTFLPKYQFKIVR